MKKHGFTLAEVLITLGIIGVVAALSAPSLVLNSRDQANGAKLAVAVSTLENAFSAAMAQEGVNDLRRSTLWSTLLSTSSRMDDNQRFVGNLSKYMNLNGVAEDVNDIYDASHRASVMTVSGGKGDTLNNTEFGHAVPVMMKNGAVCFIETFRNADALSESQAVDAGTALRAIAANVYIDVNGRQAPNTIGRDLFYFVLGQNGILYPFGGYDYGQAFGHGFNYRNDSKIDNGNFKCPPILLESEDYGKGWGCTGRIVEENYTMTY